MIRAYLPSAVTAPTRRSKHQEMCMELRRNISGKYDANSVLGENPSGRRLACISAQLPFIFGFD